MRLRQSFSAASGNKFIFKLRPPKVFLWLVSAVLILGFTSRAQASPPSEYQIKAAFLYNFAKFVEWPPQTFANENSPIVIGILGENVFGNNLEQTIHNKTINNRPLQYREFHSVAEVTNCQVLFISASEKNHFSKILGDLRGMSVLTVSESDRGSDRFIAAGGMINFVIENDRIRFQINDVAAQKAGLQISSKLLSLAVPSR